MVGMDGVGDRKTLDYDLLANFVECRAEVAGLIMAMQNLNLVNL